MSSDINEGSFALEINFTSIEISETVVIYYTTVKAPHVL